MTQVIVTGTSADNCFVDANKSWLSAITSRGSAGGMIPPIAITAPSNAAYVCATVYVGDSDYEQYVDRDTLDVRPFFLLGDAGT